MRRLLTGSLVAFAATVVFNVAAANAADLLVLNGDPAVTLSGAQSYGIVYVDGEVRLTGDTSINAGSIYFGPDARIDTCYVAAVGDGHCVAGRSLTLISSGELTVATGIDLESGTTGGPGGSLSLSGKNVAIAGPIDTSGSTGFASGSVSISSGGPISTQAIFAPGASVALNGPGPILVGGSIQTQGSRSPTPGDAVTRVQAGGSVAIDASGTAGEVDVDGAITTQGQSAPSGGGSGGPGGAVTISGTNVHTESITSYGGGDQIAGSSPGPSGSVTITASGALSAAGTIDTSGTSGAGGTGAPGASIALKAGGAVSLGSVDASGGPANPGAPISVAGTSVGAGDLNTSGGGGDTAFRNGANAAPISVTAPLGAVLGAVLAAGGSGNGSQSVPGLAGSGAGINVASSGGSISAGRVEANGGTQGIGPGAAGGAISLKAAADLTLAGDVRTDGSNAGGSSSSPWGGGNAAAVYLSAANGTMYLGGGVSARGGSGAANSANNQLGGVGGAGGQVTLIAHEVGLVASLVAAGGAGGGSDDFQGPGGGGGSITAYTDTQLFNTQLWVSTDGGDGDPTGASGNQVQEASPTALSVGPSGDLSFTTRSPGATRYELEQVVKGGATKVVLSTSKVKDLIPDTPVCQKVSLEVVATSSGVGWTSDASNVVSYERPPSKAQTCGAPAKLTLPKTINDTVTHAQHAHWTEVLRIHSAGVGRLKAKLAYKTLTGRMATVVVKLVLKRVGNRVLRLRLPGSVRSAGSGSVSLTTTSPDGRKHTTRTLRVKVSA